MYGDTIYKSEIPIKDDPITEPSVFTEKGKLVKSNTFSKKLKWVVVCKTKNLLGSKHDELPIESSYNIVGSYIGKQVKFTIVFENSKWCAKIIE
jgi:hypothetical protein